MPRVERVIVTNVSVLKMKYRERYAKIAEAVRALIAADAVRGLTSRLVALDDVEAMRRCGGAAVTQVGDQRANKHAVDAVYRTLQPDYLTILGAPDVVPHQDLINPVYDANDDDDEFAPSDLPYACEAPFSTRIEAFRGPTRVVGRLPDLNGVGDAAYLKRVLHTAATYERRDVAEYDACFGLTAAVWRKSTELSLRNTFGPGAAAHRSPKEGPGWRKSQLDPLTHFINCHGGAGDPKFYGQHGESYPVSLEAARLEDKVRRGTVVAAECCYGAELYAPKLAEGQAGICNTYLGRGAYAFFGSSTIAYGPSEGNGSADLICQFFIQRVLAGASAAARRSRHDRSSRCTPRTSIPPISRRSRSSISWAIRRCTRSARPSTRSRTRRAITTRSAAARRPRSARSAAAGCCGTGAS